MEPEFKQGKVIGLGGMGIVYEVERVDAGGNTIESNLAWKTLQPGYDNHPELLARFRREVRFLGEMNHPHIIPIVGRNLSEVPPWFLMPLAEANLRQRIDRNAGDMDWVVDTFTAVLEGVAHAHVEHDVIHRDLKPENVLIVREVPMVSDFGLCRRFDEEATRLTLTNVGFGTRVYMAPEQFRDAAHVGPAADVYALGKVLGEMLTGKDAKEGPPRLEDFPVEFRDFIGRCTADDPKKRYVNAVETLTAFQRLISGGVTTGEVSGNLEEQIETWEGQSAGQRRQAAQAIAQTLLSRQDDEEFYFRTVPRLPDELVGQLIEEQPEEFDAILHRYNEHIQGGLPYEYCDEVADLYQQVFRETDRLAHQQLVFERLFELGPTHNRWHVGYVVAELLAELHEDHDRSMIELAAGIIEREPEYANWFGYYTDQVELPARIREAFELPE